MRNRILKKLKAKKEAKEIIPKLLKRAKNAYKEGNKRLSKTYSKKIKFLYMKHKIRLPKTIKRQLCKRCDGVLIPSVNCRVRTRNRMVIYYCLDCKNYTKIGLK
ncbi:MAG: ribonuclease P Rpr2/Rpp21/SNM1 subunit [Nanoarchaeota archaeon]|nr:ribonuclease P Rpr2/Rpp21/SNM1 subunit [Nanoarchaeota archaeon]